MQFLILGILLGGPLSLYDVHKHFTGGISLFYSASFGSIQRALRQLETEGWADSADADDTRRRKKLYLITDAGRAAWRAWMLAPVTGSDAEPTILARVYLLGHLPRGERAACLDAVRLRLAGDLAALRTLAEDVDSAQIPEAAAQGHRYRRATLDYGIRSHSLALDWLEDLRKSA
ncbi:PadR family transcriptional regulator [Microbacterium sp. SD291]|uniref:PadR family transcriptional regulator n=1 Tax=Microbacterium sp. SD291 TaxID=2782007 RepID=UPI001A9750B2|nr:PadR family transcriptional regulator [Microbacterium sp. SD291]MBO0979163.1 PadR family transcriptional regulator [Microbacterium sp. SD291]